MPNHEFSNGVDRSDLQGRTWYEAADTVRRAMAGSFVFTCFLNSIQLGLPLLSMQIFDRVIPSGHLATLVTLCIGLTVAVLGSALVDSARALSLARAGHGIVALFNRERPNIQSVRQGHPDLDNDLVLLERVFSSGGLLAVFDAPFVIVYATILALINPLLGLYAVLAAVVLIGTICCSGFLEASARAGAAGSNADYDAWLRLLERAAGSFTSMSFYPALSDRALISRHRLEFDQQQLRERQAWSQSFPKALRTILQIGVLALAATLTVRQITNAGAIVASSMLFVRCVAPIQQLAQGRTALLAAGRAWSRLRRTSLASNRDSVGLPMRTFRSSDVRLVGAAVLAADRYRAVLHPINMHLKSGSLTIVLGPEAAGKSTLARLVAGSLTPDKGDVLIGGSPAKDYARDVLARKIGYLPQDPTLLPIPICQYIAKGAIADEALYLEAARLCGIDDVIRQLPEGYQTVVRRDDPLLSSGQIRRLALASAVFGSPDILVLDEPLVGLDDEGEAATMSLIETLKGRGATILVVASRSPRLFTMADLLVRLEKGRYTATDDPVQIRKVAGPREVD